jgi:uncharacterized protein (TIGR03086 family)
MSDRAGIMGAMTEDPFARYDRAAAIAEQVIAGVKADQHSGATPCTEWSVRQLINHMVTGNLAFASIVTGGPRPDRGQDHLGDDPAAAFRKATRDLRDALSAPGALQRVYSTPLGPGPGPVLLGLRTVEMAVHSWDIAKATNQSTDLDPEVAGWALGSLRQAFAGGRGERPFGPEQPAPPDATAADRLAAYAGRIVH